MSARRKGQTAEPRKSGSKSRPGRARKNSSGSTVAARCASLGTGLKDARERWEMMRAVVDVTHAAMEAEGDTTHESATTVLFHYVLEPMWDEIRRLDELIKQSRAESSS